LDSGTLNSATGLSFSTCTAGAGWYCPASKLNLSPTNNNLGLTLYGYSASGTNGVGNSGTVSLSIANADTLFATGNAAYSNLGTSSIGSAQTAAQDVLDLGLPFFYGRTIFVGIAGTNTTYPNGYWAF